ncbi:hypothetical protein ACQVP2_28210 [Methylobacterium aquaticum]|uniref:hypothetical protein n=1 Tax=Methylobacterium aquaticum TaxID=270351 RepID=UPI003D17165F
MLNHRERRSLAVSSPSPSPDPIAALRDGLEAHFAGLGLDVDLDAEIPAAPASIAGYDEEGFALPIRGRAA